MIGHRQGKGDTEADPLDRRHHHPIHFDLAPRPETANAQVEVEAQAKLITRLEALLANARWPWWRRWLG